MKARILLGVVLVLLLAGLGLIYAVWYGYLESHVNVLAPVAALLILLEPGCLPAATFLFFQSFLKVNRGADGELTYDADNFIWKQALKLSSFKEGQSISICHAFWATAKVFFSLAVGLVLIAEVSFIVYTVGRDNVDISKLKEVFQTMSLFVTYFFLLVPVAILAGKQGWKKRVGQILVIAYLLGMLSITTYTIEQRLTWWFPGLASLIILGGGFAGIVGLIVLAIFLEKTFFNTLFVQYLIALKNRVCPLLQAKQIT